MTNVTKYEMEMVVNCNIGEQTANVYTRDKSVKQKLNRLVSDYPNPDKPEKFLQFLQISSTIKKNVGGCVHVTHG